MTETSTKALRAVSLIGALGWTSMSLDSLRDPSGQTYRDAFILAPLVMYAAVLAGVHLFQRHRTGTLATAGLAITQVGMLLALIGTVGILFDIDGSEAVAFPAGPLCFMAGLAMFGYATIRAGVLPVWTGVFIILSQVNALVIGVGLSWRAPLLPHGSYTRALGHGAAMLAIALGLGVAERRRAPVPAAA